MYHDLITRRRILTGLYRENMSDILYTTIGINWANTFLKSLKRFLTLLPKIRVLFPLFSDFF